MRAQEVIYVIAGIALPAYYVPQIRTSLRDRTGMAAYSMSKAATQLLLRVAMLPFVFGIGNVTMILIVSLDFLGRTAEFLTAVWSLRRQGFDGRQVLARCLPLANLDGAADSTLPQASAGPPERYLESQAYDALVTAESVPVSLDGAADSTLPRPPAGPLERYLESQASDALVTTKSIPVEGQT